MPAQRRRRPPRVIHDHIHARARPPQHAIRLVHPRPPAAAEPPRGSTPPATHRTTATRHPTRTTAQPSHPMAPPSAHDRTIAPADHRSGSPPPARNPAPPPVGSMEYAPTGPTTRCCRPRPASAPIPPQRPRQQRIIPPANMQPGHLDRVLARRRRHTSPIRTPRRLRQPVQIVPMLPQQPRHTGHARHRAPHRHAARRGMDRLMRLPVARPPHRLQRQLRPPR